MMGYVSMECSGKQASLIGHGFSQFPMSVLRLPLCVWYASCLFAVMADLTSYTDEHVLAVL